jgi:hypothetical protein
MARASELENEDAEEQEVHETDTSCGAGVAVGGREQQPTQVEIPSGVLYGAVVNLCTSRPIGTCAPANRPNAEFHRNGALGGARAELAEMGDPALVNPVAATAQSFASPCEREWRFTKAPVRRKGHGTSFVLKPLGGASGDPCLRMGSTDLAVSTVGRSLVTHAP